MLKIYTDAAVKGNPGPAGAGFVVVGDDFHDQLTVPLEGADWDNHLAEFEAIKQALQWTAEQNIEEQVLFLYSDSKTAIDSLLKQSAKNPLFHAYTQEILSLLQRFPIHILEWIPEKENKGADNLARQALRKAEKDVL